MSFNVFKSDAFVLFYILEHLLLFLDDNVVKESKQFSDSESSGSGCSPTFG